MSRLCFINSRTDKTIYGFGATNTYWDVAAADSRVLTIDRDVTVQNQLRIEGGSTLTVSGNRTATLSGAGGSIFNAGFMNANPSFGNTLNYVISGAVGLDALSTAPVDVFNMAISGTLSLNGETLRTGNTGTITVGGTGTLNCGTGLVARYGALVANFVMSPGASIVVGSAAGITASGATGNIQTDTRTFPSTGNYTYTSSVAQVTGSGLPGTVAQLNAVNTPGVTLSGAVTVAGVVNLNNGFLALNGNGLTLGSAATFTRTAPGHVITFNGTVEAAVAKTAIAAPFTFHIGTATEYLPATVNPVSASDFNAGVFSPASSNAVPGGPAFAPADLVKFVNAIWKVDRTSGTGDADLTLGWTTALEGSSFTNYNDATVAMSRYNGTVWTPFIRNSGSNATNTVTATFNTFSPFLLGPVNLTLPVSFTAFNAVLENGRVRLNWSAQETDNLSHYELERSVNNSGFTKMRLVEAKRSGSTNAYLEFDAELLKGAHLYRVVAVGKDGDRRYSNTIRLNVSGRRLINILLNGDAAQLGIRFTGVEQGTYQLNVISAAGQVVYSRMLVHDGNDQTQLFRLAQSLPAGVYNVVLRGEGMQLNQSFVR